MQMNNPNWEQHIEILMSRSAVYPWYFVISAALFAACLAWAIVSGRRDRYDTPNIISVIFGLITGIAVIGTTISCVNNWQSIREAKINARYNTPSQGLILYEGGKLK